MSLITLFLFLIFSIISPAHAQEGSSRGITSQGKEYKKSSIVKLQINGEKGEVDSQSAHESGLLRSLYNNGYCTIYPTYYLYKLENIPPNKEFNLTTINEVFSFKNVKKNSLKKLFQKKSAKEWLEFLNICLFFQLSSIRNTLLIPLALKKQKDFTFENIIKVQEIFENIIKVQEIIDNLNIPLINETLVQILGPENAMRGWRSESSFRHKSSKILDVGFLSNNTIKATLLGKYRKNYGIYGDIELEFSYDKNKFPNKILRLSEEKYESHQKRPRIKCSTHNYLLIKIYRKDKRGEIDSYFYFVKRRYRENGKCALLFYDHTIQGNHPQWSSDGTKILYTYGDKKYQRFKIIDADTSKTSDLMSITLEPGQFLSKVRWDDKNNRIAYIIRARTLGFNKRDKFCESLYVANYGLGALITPHAITSSPSYKHYRTNAYFSSHHPHHLFYVFSRKVKEGDNSRSYKTYLTCYTNNGKESEEITSSLLSQTKPQPIEKNSTFIVGSYIAHQINKKIADNKLSLYAFDGELLLVVDTKTTTHGYPLNRMVCNNNTVETVFLKGNVEHRHTPSSGSDVYKALALSFLNCYRFCDNNDKKTKALQALPLFLHQIVHGLGAKVHANFYFYPRHFPRRLVPPPLNSIGTIFNTNIGHYLFKLNYMQKSKYRVEHDYKHDIKDAIYEALALKYPDSTNVVHKSPLRIQEALSALGKRVDGIFYFSETFTAPWSTHLQISNSKFLLC